MPLSVQTENVYDMSICLYCIVGGAYKPES